jgi:NAD(P)-dependent dehydrogenase (short-subunit alcohol dehydrogenase family)
LGIEHALALLELNAHVVLTDINIETLKLRIFADDFNKYRERITIIEMDVASLESIEAAFNQLNNCNIFIDILINNAAIDPKVSDTDGLSISSRLENFSIENWNLQVSVGLTGAFLCSRVFGSAMAKTNRGGIILNIASDLSVFSPDQRIYEIDGLSSDRQPVKPVTYSVIKAGLVGLTKYLSTYWLNKNIRVNALSPGGVYNGQNELFISKLCNLIPLGRMAKRNEYRGAIQFLCSDASSYMNGQNIVIDGGRSTW